MTTFYFAWVDETDTTWSETYEREDEELLSFEVSHSEGNFPSLTIDIRNPRIGFLNAGRKRWAWLSWLNGSSVEPLFFGRIVGVPNNVFDEVVTIQLLAQSANYRALKQAVAETLRVRPYDEIFIDQAKRDDPDAVLECRSAMWHFDRLPSGSPSDLQVSASDILSGGTLRTFTADDVFYDSLSVTLGQAPLGGVSVRATVNWTQTASGTLQFGRKTLLTADPSSLISGWPKTGASLGGGWSVADSNATNLNPVGLIPVDESPVQHTYSWENLAKKHNDGDTMSLSINWTTFPVGSPQAITNYSSQSGALTGEQNIPLKISYNTSVLVFPTDSPIAPVSTRMTLHYVAKRPFVERVEFTLTADTQEVVTASGDIESVSLSGSPVDVPILNILNWLTVAGTSVGLGAIVQSSSGSIYSICTGAGTAGSSEPTWSDVPLDEVSDGGVTWTSMGTSNPATFSAGDAPFGSSIWNTVGIYTTRNIPLSDPSSGSYFPTDRGQWSIEYLLSVARARLLSRARCVEISFECWFALAAVISCKDTALLYDSRLPGGQATGKVTSYSFSVDLTSGIVLGKVTMSSAAGYGGTVIDVLGEPTYIVDDYVDYDYQQHTGATAVVAGSDDVGYSAPATTVASGELVFPVSASDVTVSEQWTSTPIITNYTYNASGSPTSDVPTDGTLPAVGYIPILFSRQDIAIGYELSLVPVESSDVVEKQYNIAVTNLSVPKMIDLEAAS